MAYIRASQGGGSAETISMTNPDYYLLNQTIVQGGSKTYTTTKRVKQLLFFNLLTGGSNDILYFVDCEKQEAKYLNAAQTYNSVQYNVLVANQTDTTITMLNPISGNRNFSFFAWF